MDIETLRKRGKIPDRYYYQLNGKTVQENYNDIKQQQGYIYQKELSKKIEQQVKECIEKSIDEVLNGSIK